MSTLYLINDLSTSMPWNVAALHANKAWLAREGVEFAPFNPYGIETLPMHSSYWNYSPPAKGPSSVHVQWLEKVAARLDAGTDVLLLSCGANRERTMGFLRRLHEHGGISRHSIRTIVIIGRPMCVFEQRWRWQGGIPEKARIPLARRFASLASLVGGVTRAYGPEHVHLLADLSDTPKSLRQDKLTAQVFQAIGRMAPEPVEGLPCHPLIYGSSTARRLFHARHVRFNAWPHMDEAAYLACLLSLDDSWGNLPVSPPALREFLHAEGAADQAELEELLQLAPGALDAPPWLLHEAAEAVGPLDMDQVRAFATALPGAVASPLRQRLENDAPLLFHAQKRLLEGLTSRTETEFRHIGEPKPPVALTVLTMTYNHEKFIAECMDSVLAQKTEFPVRHLVLDHCSSDATPQIIAAYAAAYDTIQPVLLDQHVRAENCRGLFLRCKTKYAALCDGDDYFTDPLKLQRQVAFLETHPRSALVFHPVSVVDENAEKPEGIYPPLDMLPRGVKEEYFLADLFKGNFIQTNSVVYRWRFADGLPRWFRANLCPADWYWHLLHAELGRLGFIPDTMSAYRRHSGAMYAYSFKNAKKHRFQHGMEELETYHVVNEHFNGRYFLPLASLANGVFANFLEISMEEGDSTLLDNACEKYPTFAANFLSNLKVLKKKFPRSADSRETPHVSPAGAPGER